MTVLFPCSQCEGRGVVMSHQDAQGQPTVHGPRAPQDCPRCNGRGWLESTEMTPEELQHWTSHPSQHPEPRGREGQARVPEDQSRCGDHEGKLEGSWGGTVGGEGEGQPGVGTDV